jgi:hypothetical protein
VNDKADSGTHKANVVFGQLRVGLFSFEAESPHAPARERESVAFAMRDNDTLRPQAGRDLSTATRMAILHVSRVAAAWPRMIG